MGPESYPTWHALLMEWRVWDARHVVASSVVFFAISCVFIGGLWSFFKHVCGCK